MTKLEQIKKDVEPYKNTLVLDHFKVVLLKGVIDDVDDYYYDYIDMNRGKYLASCVGKLIPLIDQLSKEHYNSLAYIWNLNNKEKVEEI